jgi:formylmethanofuran dehydrogenase subunit B
MSTMDGHEAASAPRVVEDVVCTSCACLCDDLEIVVEGDRITEARNACTLGRARFLDYQGGQGPACLIEGRPATIDEAVERAARILAEARYPVIFGLAETTSEAQRAAVSLADWIGACVDAEVDETGGATTRAIQAVGEVTCTLGEIKNRADLIIVWRADPMESHPRLLSRYVLDPAGTFLPGGRGDRYCAVVDVRETRTAREAADQLIQIEEGGELDALWGLRALAKGVALDPGDVEHATGAPLETWKALMDRMTSAKYGVLFYGMGRGDGRPVRSIAHAAHSLVRDMNALTRFVCLPLPGAANLAGARNVLAWRTGYPSAVCLARGYPSYSPGEFNADEILVRGEADAALIVSGDPVSQLTGQALEHLSRIPCIVLSSGASSGLDPVVLFQTAVFGINIPGTVHRMDGVPLPLRTVLASSSPSDEGVLRAIERRVRSLAATGPRVTEEGERWP